MRVFSISGIGFKVGKIELDDINERELSNYTSLKSLAEENFCDFLIEKKSNLKSLPEYNLFKVLARRKWINPKYVFGQCVASIRKNASPEEIAKTIYNISVNAVCITKEKTHELARGFLK